jgi:hypothetical protein
MINVILMREVLMKNYTVSILLSLGCCIAWAQSDVGVSATVSESTDPARAAEVERKAQEISNQDDRSSGSSGKEEQVRSGDRNKKLRSHHKSKSSSGASGGAGQGSSGAGDGLRSPSQKSQSDSSNVGGAGSSYNTPGATGNSNPAGSYRNDKKLREKDAEPQPSMSR